MFDQINNYSLFVENENEELKEKRLACEAEIQNELKLATCLLFKKKFENVLPVKVLKTLLFRS
jgi:hypothetical protein